MINSSEEDLVLGTFGSGGGGDSADSRDWVVGEDEPLPVFADDEDELE